MSLIDVTSIEYFLVLSAKGHQWKLSYIFNIITWQIIIYLTSPFEEKCIVRVSISGKIISKRLIKI